ncbi:histidinol-phosphate transaminase [Parabacteroides sp. Marseille-P3160]|uniref:histidinol-phosphate transaminase n=1 Tax=Parabacteroides sp. Marseille-P3160 TaxID=1917887 RepID=UPI0009BA8B38|nr:histidinol-phosphate transaminase [Parabacteroides sp. Marseille-P3160]
MKDLEQWVRPVIWDLKPYSSARDEFHGSASVFLDANENPYNAPYNRYPDPMQWKLKKRISEIKKIAPEQIFLGNGSDEAIDLVYRAFCEPGIDSVVAIDPTYGMYKVAADINNIAYRKVPLSETFELDADRLLEAVDATTKVVFLCSPNNPTGNSLSRKTIIRVLEGFEGLVVLDEAYIDFSSGSSFLGSLKEYPNLIVLQTLSKAWGAAGIRLGMAFASPEIIHLFNKIKYPYNVNQLTQEFAYDLLRREDRMKEQLICILKERTRLQKELPDCLPFMSRIYATDANFILVYVGDANGIYTHLVEKGVIVRNRNTVTLCNGCLRITVGTKEENDALLDALKQYQP